MNVHQNLFQLWHNDRHQRFLVLAETKEQAIDEISSLAQFASLSKEGWSLEWVCGKLSSNVFTKNGLVNCR